MTHVSDYFFRGRSSWLIPLLLLAATIVIFEITDWDMAFQRLFYSPDTGWLIHLNRYSGLGLFYYTLPDYLLGCGVTAVLIYCIRQFVRKRRICWNGLYAIICIVGIPILISNMKTKNSMPYPSRIVDFGGKETKRSLIDAFRVHFKPEMKQYHGWPAGHASGGCSLVCLAFLARRRRWRWAGFGAAIAVGGFMGICHTMDGNHFISHTLVTFFIAWLVSAWLYRLMRYLRWKILNRKNAGTNC